MNTGFYENLDINFTQALDMVEKDLKHEDLIALLENGNIPEKQISALKLDNVMNQNEANILITNLTGCDGKIREAVALKTYEIVKNNPDKISWFNQVKVFADATIDINANICRLVIDTVEIISKNNEVFSKKYIEYLLKFIDETFIALDKIEFRDKKYVINKQLFKLYWCLEALKIFATQIPYNTLFPILKRCSKEREYTIREKVAQIVNLFDKNLYNDIIECLKLDENYYVRHALNH